MQEEQKLRLLSGLSALDISMDEASKLIENIKHWSAMESLFLKEVNVDTWEEAERRFPKYANREKLLQFKVKDKTMSKEFKVSALMWCPMIHII